MLTALLLGCTVFMATPSVAELYDSEESYSLTRWLGELVIKVDRIDFEDGDLAGTIIDLLIRDIELGYINSSVPSPAIDNGDPSIFLRVSLTYAYVEGRIEIDYSGFPKVSVSGNMSAEVTNVIVTLTLAFQKDERGLINLSYVPDGELGCDLQLDKPTLNLKLDSSGLDWLVNLVKDPLVNILLGELNGLLCPEIRKMVKDNLTDALGMANEFINAYWEKPANITLPLLRPMVDLRTSPFIDGIDFALNELIGSNGPLNISYIVELFTKGNGVFMLSTFLPDGFGFTIPIPDLSANLTIGLTDLVITGLDTWNNISLLVPITDVLLDSYTNMDALGINVSWYVNVSVDGEMISSPGYLYEEAILAGHMHDNVLKLGVQFASPSGVAGGYSTKQLLNMDCLGALVDPNGTGLSYFDINMTFDYIVLTAQRGNIEEDVRKLINDIATLFVDNYALAIPPFVNGLMGELGMPEINKLLSGLLGGVDCPDLKDEPFVEVDAGATAASFSVAVVVGVLVSVAPCLAVLRPASADDDSDSESVDYEQVGSSSNVEMSDLSCTPGYSASTGVSPMPPYMANDGDDDDMPPPPIPSDDEVKRQTMSYGADDDMPPPPIPSDDEVKRQTMGGMDAAASGGGEGDMVPTYLCGCKPGGKVKEFLRTDEEGASLFLHPRVSLFVRLIIPILLFATIALFISSNTGVGASVFVYLTIGDKEIGLPSLFDFGLINSVTDMWTAGVYPLSILIAFMSGIWPYLKVVLMICCWFFPTAWMKSSTRGSMLGWLDFLGKWSLLDTYVMIMMLVAFHFRIDFPVINPDVIETSIRADIYVYPAYGFVSLIVATLISLLMSHIIIGIHRNTLPETPGADCDDAMNWKIIAFYAVKKIKKPIWGMVVVVTIAVLLVLTLILTILGTVLNTFSFDFIGLAGWALPFLDINPKRAYSIISLTEEVPPSARLPNSFTVRFTQIIFILTAFVFPLMHIVAMIVLWLAPLTRKIQHYMYYTVEILSAWACLDVFVISIIAAVLEISQFADFMVGDMCDFLNPIMEEYLYDVLKPYIKCFGVVAKLESGCWILFITAIVYLAINFILLRLVHFGLAVRANNGEVPSKTEAEKEKSEKKKKTLSSMKSVGSKIFTTREYTKKNPKPKAASPQGTATSTKSQYSDPSLSISVDGNSATMAIEGSMGPSPMMNDGGVPDDCSSPPPPPPPSQ